MCVLVACFPFTWEVTSRFSIDSITNLDLRRGHRHWWHRLLECTNYDCVVSEDLVYLWFQRRSSHWANPSRKTDIDGNKSRMDFSLLLVCWQRSVRSHLEVHLRTTSVAVLLVLLPHVRDRCCPPRRSNLNHSVWASIHVMGSFRFTLSILKIVSPQGTNLVLKCEESETAKHSF